MKKEILLKRRKFIKWSDMGLEYNCLVVKVKTICVNMKDTGIGIQNMAKENVRIQTDLLIWVKWFIIFVMVTANLFGLTEMNMKENGKITDLKVKVYLSIFLEVCFKVYLKTITFT